MANTPEFIGKYKIVSLVASGGMGAVYKAVHPELKREVVIKKLTVRGSAEITERFKREAKLLLDLNDRHIVHVYDYFSIGSSRYIVMEFVDGMSADALLKKINKFSPQIAALIIYDVCRALKYSHERGVVHRDVKPANILLSYRGEVKLADFGIAASEDGAREAKQADRSARTNKAAADPGLTAVGATLGTPAYMPPEQFGAAALADRRSDIYALGVATYELLTGTKPFEVNAQERKKNSYTSPRKLNPAVPRVFCRIVKKSLKLKPSRRYQDTAPIIKKLEKYLRKYSVTDIRVALVKSMKTGIAGEQSFSRRGSAAHKAVLAFICACALITGGFALWTNGVIHRFILRPWYAPVTVALSVPRSASASEDIQFKAFFFRDDDGSIPEIKSKRRVLNAQSERKFFLGAKTNGGENQVLYRAKTVWLERGRYRVKIAGAQRVWWESFALESGEKHIQPDFGAARSRPLSVYSKARDAKTGKEIVDARTLVFISGEWVVLNERTASALTTGTVHRLLVRAPGYQDAVFALKIDWFQDELFLNASLYPQE